jgi:DNA adenine methylase
MADTLFQYPGGKSGQYDRIKAIMPDHICFVEAFGGSGAVTLNKPDSEVNVYNDLDSDITHFFTVYREAPERLIEWVEKVPYSYEHFEDFTEIYYKGEFNDPPLRTNLAEPEEITDSHIRRAGVFFCLRYFQWGAKYSGKAGFGRSKVQNGATTFSNARERLDNMIGCWDSVTIENLPYDELEGPYDSEDTLWYFDPPYVGTEQYYVESGFEHEPFTEWLMDLEGYWIVSYDELPECLQEQVDKHDHLHTSVEESTNFIDSGLKGEGKDTIETIVTNYDPSEVTKFVSSNQTGIKDSSWGAETVNTPANVSNGEEAKHEPDSNENDEFLSEYSVDVEEGFLDG